MSGLPKEIHIKQRKRGRDNEAGDTPNYLQVDQEFSIKRRMSSRFLYQRRTLTASHLAAEHEPAPPSAEAPPVIQTSKPGGERNNVRKQSGIEPASTGQAQQRGDAAAQPEGPSGPNPSPASHPTFQPRSFHMSRSSMNAPPKKPSKASKAGAQGISKRNRYGTAVFVERGNKKASALKKKALETVAPDDASGGQEEDQDAEMRNAPAPSFKKPTVKRLAPRPSTDALVKSATPGASPPGEIDASDGKGTDNEPQEEAEPQRKPLPRVSPMDDPDKIAADMDQWVLHEIGLNIKEMDMQKQQQERQQAAKAVASPSRLRPKAPAQRFAQRNPQLARKLAGGTGGPTEAGQDEDDDDDDDAMGDADGDASDDDYEIVVYELAPRNGTGPALALGNIRPEEIGILKFDSKEDMELFYGDENEDEDYDPDDEEDENAENHYTAEYPEELDSDDSEFDGRDGNGSRAYLGDGFDDDDEDAAGLSAYYRVNGEFDGGGEDDDDDDDNDRYIIEGDDESRDRDDVFQEHIRRYIRRHGGG